MSNSPSQCWDFVLFGAMHVTTLSEFICVLVLLCLENIVFLESCTISGSYNFECEGDLAMTSINPLTARVDSAGLNSQSDISFLFQHSMWIPLKTSPDREINCFQ